MTNHHGFKPIHINATPLDFVGNGDIGRYMLIPGSNGRAKEIASSFEDVIVKTHPRGHDLYLGKLYGIDVGAIASGMGCASMEIILHELFELGAKRFLRVGTAGSMQEELVNVGDIVIAQASVRDDRTTLDYVPQAVPAVASIPLINAAEKSAKFLGTKYHTGIVHCKSSFYAREFHKGPNQALNDAYTKVLIDYGVLASEMETSALFIQTQYYNHTLSHQNPEDHRNQVLAGAILSIISSLEDHFAPKDEQQRAIEHAIDVSLETIKVLAESEI